MIKDDLIFLHLHSCTFIKDGAADTPASCSGRKGISGITPTVNYQKSWRALSETACRGGRDVGGNKEMDFAFNESQTGG